MGFHQLQQLSEHDVPAHIEALDRNLTKNLDGDRAASLEYRFRVVVTLENATKSKAHIRFLHPDEELSEDIRNVLIKKEIADDGYPYRAMAAVSAISKKAGKKFTSHNHTQAWRFFDVRPKGGVKEPQNTNKDFCIYHAAHGDYTYSQAWIDHVVAFIECEIAFDKLKKS